MDQKQIKERLIIERFLRDESYLIDRIEQYTITCNQLNQRLYKIIEVSPFQAIIELDDNNEPRLTRQFDINTEKILEKIKQDNESYVKTLYNDLFIFQEYLDQVHKH